MSGSVRHTGNAIEQVRLPTDEPCITAQTFVNVAANAFYRLSLYGLAKPTAKQDISGGDNVRYIVRRSLALNAGRWGLTASISLNYSVQIPEKAHGAGLFLPVCWPPPKSRAAARATHAPRSR